jgi:glycerol-1-phosphate dehydrogenase [NAD(P)+]
MQLPREVIIGNGIIEGIGGVARRLGFTQSALIVTGSKTYEIVGKTVQKHLEEYGIKVDVFLTESATVKEVEMVEAKIERLKPQVVLGVGGGTKIDVAKFSAMRQGVPCISVPTTASHDGIASPSSSVKGLEKPFSVIAEAPIAIIADTNVILKAPYRMISSGAADVIAKFTAVRDWKLAHEDNNEYYGEYAASLALMSAKLVIQSAKIIKPESEEGLRVLLEALISCGVSMSIAGSTRPCSGSEHLFSHALDIIRSDHAMHGEQCGVGTIIMAYLHRANWKLVRGTLKRLGAPTTAKELDVDKDDVVKAILMASTIRPDRYTILNRVNLTEEYCKRIAEITEVI